VQTSYKPGLLRIANPNPNRHVVVAGGPIVRSISPLPASDVAHVTIESATAQEITLKVVDQQGALVFETTKHAVAGTVKFEVDVRLLTPGVYTVIAGSAASTHATSMVVLKP
jgi:hypothetical protein